MKSIPDPGPNSETQIKEFLVQISLEGPTWEISLSQSRLTKPGPAEPCMNGSYINWAELNQDWVLPENNKHNGGETGGFLFIG